MQIEATNADQAKEQLTQPSAGEVTAHVDVPSLDANSTVLNTSEIAASEEGAAVNRKSGRPVGISKIDLRTVWGSKTPLVAADSSLQPGEQHTFHAW